MGEYCIAITGTGIAPEQACLNILFSFCLRKNKKECQNVEKQRDRERKGGHTRLMAVSG